MEELTRLEERIMQCIWDYQGEVPFLVSDRDSQRKAQ